ncbi:hypothetical protein C6499_05320 [Candidatus Poribacteria bacterium]|nr:MAG: hypothetical protein C6499_05320 [Candidatus Poribacteria bacterium]
MRTIRATTGLEDQHNLPRFHYDIYAILEGGQELYFGHETQVNVNVVEKVKISRVDGEEIEKCYLSPTKRRGVERRVLIWAPKENGFLGDSFRCGVPHTCSQPKCPICRVFGGLITDQIKEESESEPRKATTMIGRLTHGGGVAIQVLAPEEKQRAMHPSKLQQQGEETPMPFKREYNEPGLLYPIYNHCLSMTESEFSSVAYAFMGSLARLGAGNPKGLKIFEDKLTGEMSEPWIVVDRYLSPIGKRPIVSPSITVIDEAQKQFKGAVFSIGGEKQKPDSKLIRGSFHRYIGDAAIVTLSKCIEQFEAEVLTNVDAETDD